MALLQPHTWPGNVRELHTLLRTASLLAGPAGLITPEHLPDELQDAGSADAAKGQSLRALELQSIRAAVDAAGGNIALAARRLGVGRNTIYRKLRWGPAAPGG
jgi:transcriptional regulator of acetoin/glycerol metabolism